MIIKCLNILALSNPPKANSYTWHMIHFYYVYTYLNLANHSFDSSSYILCIRVHKHNKSLKQPLLDRAAAISSPQNLFHNNAQPSIIFICNTMYIHCIRMNKHVWMRHMQRATLFTRPIKKKMFIRVACQFHREMDGH